MLSHVKITDIRKRLQEPTSQVVCMKINPTDIRKRLQEPTSQVVCMKINPSSNRQLAPPGSN